jgi:large subunit ribosomal protein L6
MSRIGLKPIPIPSGVKVALAGRTVSVDGPKGKLSWTHRDEIEVTLDDSARRLLVARKGEDRLSKSLHGLTRSLIANMVAGCLEGYSKTMELYGVGFGVQLQGNKLSMTCGYSHPVVFNVSPGLGVEVKRPQARGDSEPAVFTVSGADKQAVGELAARIRRSRPPEPYNGKGVRYAGERIKRKVGKAFAGGGS